MMSRSYINETHRCIYMWAEQVFEKRLAPVIAARTSLEICELVIAYMGEHSREKKVEEIADCAIMMWQLAFAHNIDARPVSSTSFISALEESPVGYALAIFRSFATYMERANAKGAHDAPEHLKKALMALEELANIEGIELPGEVDRKMLINRARTWEKLVSGHFQHVAVA